MYNEAIRLAAEFWLHAFKKRPVLTILFTIISISIPIAGTIIDSHFSEKRRFEKNYSDPQISAQLEELEKVSKNLKELSLFVTMQKEKVANQHETLKKLQEEKQQLEPVVNAQKELVEGIFALQEKRQAKQKWWDMGLGFVLGRVKWGQVYY